jgi:hypothetical protein
MIVKACALGNMEVLVYMSVNCASFTSHQEPTSSIRKGENDRRLWDPMERRTRAPTPSSTSSAYTVFVADRESGVVPVGAMTDADDCGVVILDTGVLDLLVAERPPSARRKLKASLHERRVSSTRGGVRGRWW